MTDESEQAALAYQKSSLEWQQRYNIAVAERDALRNQWSGMLIEQERLVAQRDDAIAERDALRTFVFVSGRWIKKYGTYNAVPTPEALEDFGELMEAYNALAVQP